MQQNNVKGQKDPNGEREKNAKNLHKVPKCAKKNCTKNREIATLLTFPIKQHTILQRFLPKIGFSLHEHCSHIHTFFHLWIWCQVG